MDDINSSLQFAKEATSSYLNQQNDVDDANNNKNKTTSKLTGLKPVPWLSWDEWDNVRINLLSSSPDAVASALKRISAWQSNGFVPVEVDVTAAIIDIWQRQFRKELPADGLLQQKCMAIMRLVNGVVDKTRNKTEISICGAAD